MSVLHWIQTTDSPDAFPPVETALRQPDGLLAAGGDLSTARLLSAYRRGIFPWYEEGQPLLWWSPDPRCVLQTDKAHVSRRLQRQINQREFRVSLNTAFDQVISACAEPRAGQAGTWITSDMALAYRRLHREGWAHSVEVWQDDKLVGGIYGISIGAVFFGESMFSRVSNASKIALVTLARWMEHQNLALIDCQVKSAHLLSLGSIELSRRDFVLQLSVLCDQAVPQDTWAKKPEIPV